jgi:uncharacterized RDD family membrane protein YckC
MYLVLDSKSAGPFTLDQVRSMWVQNKIDAQTLFFREGQTEWLPLERIVPELFPVDPTHTVNAVYAMPGPECSSATRIGGFWRRIGAAIVDLIILGIFGFVLGTIFFDLFAQMGMRGRLIGAAILLVYFGLQESELAGGQTPAKRLLRIRVVGRDGRCLSVGRSLARTALWVAPYVVNDLPISKPEWLLLVLGLFVMSFFFAVTYLLAFNTRTRQTLYDILTDSYVVRTETPGVVDLLPVWKWHYAIIAAWCGLWIIIASALTLSGIFNGFMSSVLALQEKAAALPDVQYVTIAKSVSLTSGQDKGTTTVTITVTYTHQLADENKAVRNVAAAVLADREDIGNPDYLIIEVGREYDIGIASGRFYNSVKHSPDEWEKIINTGS